MYSHKQTDARKIRLVIAIMIAALMLAACKDGSAGSRDRGIENAGNTPRTQVPEVLVGRWEHGESGGSSSLSFTADGNFEFASWFEVSLYGCDKTFFTYKSGTMTVAGNTITLYPQVSDFKRTDSCNPQNNYEEPDSLEPEAFLFQLGTDVLGVFMVRHRPDGQVTVYRKG